MCACKAHVHGLFLLGELIEFGLNVFGEVVRVLNLQKWLLS